MFLVAISARRCVRGIVARPVTDWPELQPRPELVNPALDWLAGLNEEEYRRSSRFTGRAREI